MHSGDGYNNKGLVKPVYGRGPQAYREATEGPQLYDGRGNPSEAAARQVGGNHYLGKTITHWGIVDEYGLDHYRGSAIKYIIRNKMDTYQDIEKAVHYLEKWLEVNQGLQKKDAK